MRRFCDTRSGLRQTSLQNIVGVMVWLTVQILWAPKQRAASVPNVLGCFSALRLERFGSLLPG